MHQQRQALQVKLDGLASEGLVAASAWGLSGKSFMAPQAIVRF